MDMRTRRMNRSMRMLSKCVRAVGVVRVTSQGIADNTSNKNVVVRYLIRWGSGWGTDVKNFYPPKDNVEEGMRTAKRCVGGRPPVGWSACPRTPC